CSRRSDGHHPLRERVGFSNDIASSSSIPMPLSNEAQHAGLRYRPDIDGLRAIAVVPVVLYHYGVPGFGGGFVGVDIFFVISGYLITSLINGDVSRGDFSILRFY